MVGTSAKSRLKPRGISNTCLFCDSSSPVKIDVLSGLEENILTPVAGRH